MKEIKIALLQIMPGNNIDENLEIGIRACRKAKKDGADMVLFPEMWSNGYKMVNDVEELKRNAISVDSKFIKAFQRLAQELNLAIAITFLESYEPLPRNTVILFDRFGKQILTYAKVHTCDFDLEKNLTPGNDFYVANLNTEKGNLKIGAMICYDREFPESARILMLKGAEVILVPNDCGSMQPRIRALSTRAYENMVAVAMANPNGDNAGCSCAFSPICWDRNGECVDNTVLLADDKTEGIFYAEFDMEAIREYRNREMLGNTFRKVESYSRLLSKEIKEPFIRDGQNG